MNLVIPDFLPPPVLNTSRQRHWSAVRREAQNVKMTVWAYALAAGWKPDNPKPDRQRLTVVFVFPNRRQRDADNLYARAKHVVDGLKVFLVDDDLEHLDLVVQAEVRPRVKETHLYLEAVP
jgi:hypothetical protein